jgi:Tol biopolymer transport system component
MFSDLNAAGTSAIYYQVNPDGSGQKQLYSLSLNNYEGLALNPAVKGQIVFGYSPSGVANPAYGIYLGSAANSSTSTQLVAPVYYSIQSIQVSIDGAWVYYIAQLGQTGNSELYKLPIAGGTPIVLDSDSIYSANVDTVTGTQVVYDKNYTYVGGNSESAVFIRSTAVTGTPTQLTVDSSHNYEWPQFSKDGTKIVLTSDKNDPFFEVYTMASNTVSTNGSGLTQVTSNPTIDKESGVTFSADGTMAAYIGLDTAGSANGVYRSGVIGTQNPSTLIVPDSHIQAGIYWTSATGRARGGTTGYLSRNRHKGLIP